LEEKNKEFQMFVCQELNDQAAQLNRIRKDFKTSSDEKQRLQSVLSALESEKMVTFGFDSFVLFRQRIIYHLCSV
jgi:hypothetical protein